jgi:hypothetical protein
METQQGFINPSFKVNLHTSEHQNHSVQYLHSVKHTKLGHKPYKVYHVTSLDTCYESFLESYLECTLHL